MQSRAKNKKQSGVLLAVSSLSGPDGIGTLGQAAYKFVDFLKSANQRYWQILPLNPIDCNNSPYKSVSTLAGEILYIDLTLLVKYGLLNTDEIPHIAETPSIDYDTVRTLKISVLKKATARFDRNNAEYRRFLKENSDFIYDFSILQTAKEVYNTRHLSELPDGIKYRQKDALNDFCKRYSAQIEFYKITQFLFCKQYFALKEYANRNNIKIIGDIPFYVSPDSVDVWTAPDNFKVGRDLTPTLVAGVPPDIFSSDGQLWGNPVYDWNYMKKDGFSWWKNRLMHCKAMFDVTRIDHFRAFADYYSIPSGSPTARSGNWEKGVGKQFFDSVFAELGPIDIIAEDLGGEDSVAVQNLLKQTGFPNMKVLQFAFNGKKENPFLPENYTDNCVCYTGTHDNDTALGWFEKATEKQKVQFLRLAENQNLPIPHRMIRIASSSKANLVIIPFQDLLCVGTEGRMNTPGTKNNNWRWRMGKKELNENAALTLKKLTEGRN